MTIPETGLTYVPGQLRGGTTGQVLKKSSNTDFDVEWGAGGGSGTVTSFSFTDANGITSTVTNPTTTPNLTLALGAITPSSINASGNVTAGSLTVNGLGIAAGIPSGGASNQILQKNTSSNYDVSWINADFIPNKTVANYAALPAAAASSGQLAICLASQGIWPLSSYKAAGLYYSDGITWTYEGDYTLTQNASQIVNVPAGNIAATNVQDALNELDTEKVPTTTTVNGQALSGNVTISTISGNAGTATALQTARTIGGVSFDGTANIVPQTIQSVNEATDTTCFPLFISASGTQSLQPLNNAGLTYNSNTNNLSATTFTGALSGNASTVTTNANLTGPVTSTGNATAIANGAISNAMLANGAVANLSGTNTGDQTITLTGDVTGSGTGSFAATIAASVYGRVWSQVSLRM